MNRKSIILSIKGLKLSKEEYSLIQNEKPWGIILFKRNIKNINQLKSLTSEIKKAMNDPLYPILVDEDFPNVKSLKSCDAVCLEVTIGSNGDPGPVP